MYNSEYYFYIKNFYFGSVNQPLVKNGKALGKVMIIYQNPATQSSFVQSKQLHITKLTVATLV